MDNIVTQIEVKCHEKLMIYHDLLDLFRKERKSIVNADVTALWRFSSEKQAMAENIETIRKDILTILESAFIRHEMTEKTFELESIAGLFGSGEADSLLEHLITINRVKTQIQTAGTANRLFIEEYLSTINDLVNVITCNENKAELYNQSKNVSKIRDQETVLLSREV